MSTTTRILRVIGLSMAVLMLSGCGLFEEIRSYTNIDGGRHTIAEEKYYANYSNAHWSKVQGFFAGSTNYIRMTNLAQLVADESGVSDQLACGNTLDPGQCLSLAEKLFTDKFVSNSPENKTPDSNGWIIRNIIQERLIMASNSACREFTQHLNTFQASSNFVLGAAAVGTGAAGAIVTAATAARTLAGTTGALSGSRAELNADIFENKFVPVITRSIDDRRRTFLSALRGYEVASGMRPLPESEVKPGSTPPPGPPAKAAAATAGHPAGDPAPTQGESSQLPDWKDCTGSSSNVVAGQNEMNAEYQLPPNGYQCLPLQRYPLEAAIADAIYYNDLCSLDKGLENIQVALDMAKHPGLDELAAAQDAENLLLQKQLAGLKTQQEIIQQQIANDNARRAGQPNPTPPKNKPAMAGSKVGGGGP
jgi:hypothetical protein